MKKNFTYGFLAIFTIIGLLAINHLAVSANPGSNLSGGEAGVWQYPDDLQAKETRAMNFDYPDYLQMITDALTIDRPAKICHTFQGAKSGWIPEFRQWSSYRWHEIKDETVVYHNTTEDTYFACVTPATSGEFALFARYPVSPTKEEMGNVYTNSSMEFTWSAGTKTDVDLLLSPIPDWLQVFSSGVTTNGKTQICSPFTKAPSGWTPEIYQLINGQWRAIKTDLVYPSGKEGSPYACADVDEGTYLLLGYYKGISGNKDSSFELNKIKIFSQKGQGRRLCPF